MIHTIKKFIAAGEKPPLHFQDLKPATFAEFLKTIRKRNGCIPKVQAYYRRRSALYQFFEMYDQKTTPEFDRELDLQLKAVKMVIITRNDDPNYDNEHPLSAKDQEFEGFDISHFPEIPEPTVSAPTDFSKVTFSHDIINAAIAASPRESYIDLNTSFIVWLLENKQMLLTNDIT